MTFFMSGAAQKLVLFCPCACQGIFLRNLYVRLFYDRSTYIATYVAIEYPGTWGTGVENFCTAEPLVLAPACAVRMSTIQRKEAP